MSGRLSQRHRRSRAGPASSVAVRLHSVDADAVRRRRRDPDGTPPGRVALGRRRDRRQALRGRRRAVRSVQTVGLGRAELATAGPRLVADGRLQVHQERGGEVARVTDPGADEIVTQSAGDNGHEKVVEGTACHILHPHHGGHAQRTSPRYRPGAAQLRAVQQVAVVHRKQLLYQIQKT